MPASALHGCKIDGLREPLPEGARASDQTADGVAIIEALVSCHKDYLSLVNHVRIACPEK